MKGYKVWLSLLFLVLLRHFSTLASLAAVHSTKLSFQRRYLVRFLPHRCLSPCLMCGRWEREGHCSLACEAHVNGQARGHRCTRAEAVGLTQTNDPTNVFWLARTALVNLLSLVQLSRYAVICECAFWRKLGGHSLSTDEGGEELFVYSICG